ncbi:SRPBCC family protein [Actinokineospora soli]
MIDVDHQISAVSRSLGTRTIAAGEARVLSISQTYKADVADVFDAVTSPERLPRWFLPVSGDLSLGGRYQFEGNAGGVIERCDPPTGFAATWEFGGEVSWIEVTITEEGDGARLTLEHIAHVTDEMWAQYGPGAVGIGWDGALSGLARHLAGAGPVDMAEVEAWSASPEGKRFYRETSARWAEASIAAGTPEAEARAAADRVTAFYSPEP